MSHNAIQDMTDLLAEYWTTRGLRYNKPLVRRMLVFLRRRHRNQMIKTVIQDLIQRDCKLGASKILTVLSAIFEPEQMITILESIQRDIQRVQKSAATQEAVDFFLTN